MKIKDHASVLFGGTIIAVLIVTALLAPLLGTRDPTEINPVLRNKTPGYVAVTTDAQGNALSRTFVFGTDSVGRDIYSRTIYGSRTSLTIGAVVAVVSIVFGVGIGLVAGFVRSLDGVVMRIMDGVMAVPTILLAICIVSVSRAGLSAVIASIVIPEVPRVVRVVRGVVLSVREEPYVDAAATLGTSRAFVLIRHILPSTIAPVIVQGTFICASAILIEAVLSFLGIGVPPETPTWGNIMAEGRALFRVYPHNLVFPGIALTITILAINALGDGLRDMLDPRYAGSV